MESLVERTFLLCFEFPRAVDIDHECFDGRNLTFLLRQFDFVPSEFSWGQAVLYRSVGMLRYLNQFKIPGKIKNLVRSVRDKRVLEFFLDPPLPFEEEVVPPLDAFVLEDRLDLVSALLRANAPFTAQALVLTDLVKKARIEMLELVLPSSDPFPDLLSIAKGPVLNLLLRFIPVCPPKVYQQATGDEVGVLIRHYRPDSLDAGVLDRAFVRGDPLFPSLFLPLCPDYEPSEQAYRDAVRQGSPYVPAIPSRVPTPSDIVSDALRSGRLSVLKWAIWQSSDLPPDLLDKAIRLSPHSGGVEVFLSLHEYLGSPELCETQIDALVRREHLALPVVQKLNLINTFVLRCACEYFHYELMRWLLRCSSFIVPDEVLVSCHQLVTSALAPVSEKEKAHNLLNKKQKQQDKYHALKKARTDSW